MPRLLAGVPLDKTVVFVDTCTIIEAVRTEVWNRLTGAVRVETVEKCREEALAGAVDARPRSPLDYQHETKFLQRFRTEYLLELKN